MVSTNQRYLWNNLLLAITCPSGNRPQNYKTFSTFATFSLIFDKNSVIFAKNSLFFAPCLQLSVSCCTFAAGFGQHPRPANTLWDYLISFLAPITGAIILKHGAALTAANTMVVAAVIGRLSRIRTLAVTTPTTTTICPDVIATMRIIFEIAYF